MPIHARALACASLVVCVGCWGTAAAPEAAEAPSTMAPSANAARVLFVLGAPAPRRPGAPLEGSLGRPWPLVDGTGVGVDVLDESGALVGRLRPRSWVAVDRPPGRNVFYAVETSYMPCDEMLFGSCGEPEARADVAYLEASLAAGRTYAVWLGTAVTFVGVDTNETGCAMWSQLSREGDPSTMHTSTARVSGSIWDSTFMTRDLVAVQGASWAVVDELVSSPETGAMQVAPRDLAHPYAADISAAATARVGHCWDRTRSTLLPEHGRTSP